MISNPNDIKNHEIISLWFRNTVYRSNRIRVRPSLDMKLSRSHSHALLLVFLIISGDIQMNAGPDTTINFPQGLQRATTRLFGNFIKWK